MKILKKSFLSVLSILLIVCISITAYGAYTLNCWYAYKLTDTGQKIVCDTIFTWGRSQIAFAHKKLNSKENFGFYAGNLEGQETWKPVLGISFKNVLLMKDADICVYGGTLNELNAIGMQITSSQNGVTNSDYYPNSFEYVSVMGRTKGIGKFTKSKTAIVDNDRTVTNIAKTCTHELGHALGWDGHSIVSGDLMYFSSEFSNGLTERDKAHLKQVY